MLVKEKDILPVKEQYRIRDEWMTNRMKNLLPALMKECKVDLWVIVCGEYNEDPIFRTVTPALMQSASRTSCVMFEIAEDGSFHALSFCRPNGMLLSIYEQGYDPKEEDQWAAIRRKMKSRKDGNVVVNVSSNNGQVDGLSKRLYDTLTEDPEIKVTTDSKIGIRWLETRTEEELLVYPDIYRIAMTIQAEAYSRDVIKPGVTTTTDLEWYILQRINDMGLTAWFSPDVDLQRPGRSGRLFGEVIQEGDLLHTDMGISYLGLCTDSQRLAYVLKEGETEIPEGIMQGFKRGNRFQDIVREEMQDDRTGDEIFLAAMEKGKAEGIRPMLYTHPIGNYGHGSGPLFGLYDAQRPVPVRGELPLKDSTCYALELNVLETVPEWGDQDVYFYMEETIGYKNGEAYFMDPAGREKIAIV